MSGYYSSLLGLATIVLLSRYEDIPSQCTVSKKSCIQIYKRVGEEVTPGKRCSKVLMFAFGYQAGTKACYVGL